MRRHRASILPRQRNTCGVSALVRRTVIGGVLPRYGGGSSPIIAISFRNFHYRPPGGVRKLTRSSSLLGVTATRGAAAPVTGMRSHPDAPSQSTLASSSSSNHSRARTRGSIFALVIGAKGKKKARDDLVSGKVPPLGFIFPFGQNSPTYACSSFGGSPSLGDTRSAHF